MANAPTDAVVDGSEEDDFPWHLGVYDSHCHPTDTMRSLADVPHMRARTLVIMATRTEDQDLVAQAAAEDAGPGNKIIPSFGHHPWFAHHVIVSASGGEHEKLQHYQTVLTPSPDPEFIASLPDPIPLSSLIADIEARLQRHPFALIGEVGLDKAFRLPRPFSSTELDERDSMLTLGGREGRPLTQHSATMDHQRKVLLAQLELAGRLQRAASIHGVQAHGALYDALHSLWKGHELPSKRELKRRAGLQQDNAGSENPVQYPPRICLHSYSGPLETAKRYLDPLIPTTVFFSFSICVNFSSRVESKIRQTEQVIRALPDDQILVESDLHTAGAEMDDYLEMITRRICALKGWSLEQGVMQLGQNWKHFVHGSHDDGMIQSG